MVSPKKSDFWPRINILLGKKIKKILQRMSVHQKLGITLESKVVQKLSLEKNVFYKKFSPKLIFLDEFFFDIEN